MTQVQDSYISATIYLVAGIGTGIFLELFVLRKLSRIAGKTQGKLDDTILRSVRGLLLVWSMLIGSYFFLHDAPLASEYIDLADRVMFALTVLSVSLAIARTATGLIKNRSVHARENPSSSIISNITRIAVYLIGVLIVLQSFGISITPVLTALGVGALAVALALQETLSNLFAGLQIVASRQIKIGDYVKVDSGEEGYVADITWRNTIVRALANNYVIIPNSKIASAIVTNYYRPDKEIAVLVELSVSYDSDLDKVEDVTIEVGKEVLKNLTGGVASFEPFIRYHTFGDSAIKFSVILRGKEFTDQYLVKHQFIKLIMERYKEHNIIIPYPIRNVIIKESK